MNFSNRMVLSWMDKKGQSSIVLKPMGVVHSSVKDTDKMPVEGVPARIEVFVEFSDGLKDMESNTHVIILGWFHRADREKLQVTHGDKPTRGVFGLRSQDRPNPVGLNMARLISVKGRELYLDRLDMIDGTPVIDLKRYSPGWDSIFSARTSRDLLYPEGRAASPFIRDMLVEAVNFHGEYCRGAALGTRILFHSMDTWKIGKKDPDLLIQWGEDGCINDALQALTGATHGNDRLAWKAQKGYTIAYQKHKLTFVPKERLPDTVDDILEDDIHLLFCVEHGNGG